MGQIVSSAAKPKRCNLNQLSQVPTPAAGEYILVSSDNSMNAAGQGNFDCYIEGNGTMAATALELKKVGKDIYAQLGEAVTEIVQEQKIPYGNHSYTVNGVSVVMSADGTYTFSGTGTSNGGRAARCSPNFYLKGGKRYVIDRGSYTGNVYFNRVGGSSRVISGTIWVDITTEEEGNFYIGFNVSNGTTYDITFSLRVIEDVETTRYIAKDEVARAAITSISQGVEQAKSMIALKSESYYKNILHFTAGGWEDNGSHSNNTYSTYATSVMVKFDEDVRIYAFNIEHPMYVTLFTYTAEDYSTYTKVPHNNKTMADFIVPAGTFFVLGIQFINSSVNDGNENLISRLHVEPILEDIAPITQKVIRPIGLTSISGNQGIFNIGETLYGCSPSRIYNNGQFINVPMEHMNDADYCALSNAFLTNSMYNETYPNELYVLNGAKEIIEGKFASENDRTIQRSDFVVIAFATEVDSGYTLVLSCFGEQADIIYVGAIKTTSYTGNTANILYKVQLGYNASTNAYDGTYTIVWKRYFNYNTELQGSRYVNGKLLLSTDNKNNSGNYGHSSVSVVDLETMLINEYISRISEAEKTQNMESEGITIIDGVLHQSVVNHTTNAYAIRKYYLEGIV